MSGTSSNPGMSRATLDALVAELTDQGFLIEAGFASLRAAAMPADTDPMVLRELRMAFFAGAQHLFASICQVMDPGDEPTAQDLARIQKIAEELERFINQFEAERLPTRGNA